jgi:hypothetical protein
MDVARTAQAFAPRVAPSFLNLMRRKQTLNIQLLQVSENFPIPFFLHKMHEINL